MRQTIASGAGVLCFYSVLLPLVCVCTESSTVLLGVRVSCFSCLLPGSSNPGCVDLSQRQTYETKIDAQRNRRPSITQVKEKRCDDVNNTGRCQHMTYLSWLFKKKMIRQALARKIGSSETSLRSAFPRQL